jgi:hypothetical protein
MTTTGCRITSAAVTVEDARSTSTTAAQHAPMHVQTEWWDRDDVSAGRSAPCACDAAS